MTSENPTAPASLASYAPDHQAHESNFWLMTLGSTGVVFGDIGTSPLYAMKAALDHAKTTGVAKAEIFGIVSLIIWALIVTVTVKYVIFLMRADNKGEGGTLSLMALAQNAIGTRTKTIFLLGVAGAALFCGDAIITPAISVLSAVEGLKLAPVRAFFDFSPYVLTITTAILIGLFVVQRFGTTKVAVFFGPIMVAFFAIIAGLGLPHILAKPEILAAFNPTHGVKFLTSNGMSGFTTLGLVFLAVTGAEALYADMGHFGRQPIQTAWCAFILPALLINYLGQGALILEHPEMVKSENFSPFFQMAPTWSLLPLISLATVATVIASQAVISGAFSIVRQAVQLGLLPRMLIHHKSEEVEGQIFIPRVNRLLLIGVLMVVALFRSSDSLANAYGIAVTGTMVVTTALAFIVARKLWKWPLLPAALLIGGFLAIDLSFLAANCVKFLDGGWMPLTIGAVAMVIMWTWSRGVLLLQKKSTRDSIPLADMISMFQKSAPLSVPGLAVFLVADPKIAPAALMHNVKHNKVLHERIILLKIAIESTPRMTPEKRIEIDVINDQFKIVTAHYGFMENASVPKTMAILRKLGVKFDIMTTSFFVSNRSVKPAANSEMPSWQRRLFVALTKQSADATEFFSIPSDRVVELGSQISI